MYFKTKLMKNVREIIPNKVYHLMYIQISGQVRDLTSSQVQDYVCGQISNQIFFDLHKNVYNTGFNCVLILQNYHKIK